MKMQAGICPLCGGELEYHGDQEIRDDYATVSWTCMACGATGHEDSDIVFESHRGVCDAKGKEIDLHQPMDTFWVSWIEQDSQGRVCKCGVFESFLSFEKAMDEIKFREKKYGERLISIWVERYNDRKKIDIPFHRVYVDIFGDRVG